MGRSVGCRPVWKLMTNRAWAPGAALGSALQALLHSQMQTFGSSLKAGPTLAREAINN